MGLDCGQVNDGEITMSLLAESSPDLPSSSTFPTSVSVRLPMRALDRDNLSQPCIHLYNPYTHTHVDERH